MSLTLDLTIKRDDPGIRPAGPPDACFYCKRTIGQEHAPDCVVIHRKVRVRFSFEIEVETVASSTPDEIEFHFNESSWCADNAIDLIQESVLEGECLCGKLTATYLGETDGVRYLGN